MTRSQLAFLSVVVLSGQVTFAAQQRAWTTDRASYSGRLEGSSPGSLRFVRDDGGNHIPAAHLTRVEFAPGSFVWPTTRPPRTIRFWGNERMYGELREWNAESVSFAFAGLAELTFPSWAVAEMGCIAGEADIAYESFESLPTILKSEILLDLDAGQSRSGKSALPLHAHTPVLTFLPDESVRAGRLSLWYLTSSSEQSASAWSIVLVFETPVGPQSVRFQFSPVSERRRVESSPRIRLAAQPLPSSDGWRKLTVLLQPSFLRMFVDQAALASASSFEGALRQIRFECHSTSKAEASNADLRPGVWIDDFLLTRFVERHRPQRSQRNQDGVILRRGDELYGELLDVGSTGVLLRGRFGNVQTDWSQIRACRQKLQPTRSNWVRGVVSRILLQQPVDVPYGRGEFLIGAIQSANANGLVMVHPFLGELTIAAARIRRIEPMFSGSSLLVTPETNHLGDEVRPSFMVPHPGGNTLERSFEVERLPAGKVFLSAEVTELEASGPETPPASPFLAELRDGFLKTSLRINERRIADVNDMVSIRRRTGDAERIRIPIPTGTLNQGRNTFRLEQRASRTDANNFDDFEISRIAIEFENP